MIEPIAANIVAVGLCGLMVASTWRWPSLALLVYAGTASYADGYGPREWLAQAAYFALVMNTLFVVLFFRASWVMFREHRRRATRTTKLGLAMLLAVGWCLFGVLVGGGGVLAPASHLPYLVIPYVVIWVAFVAADRSRRLITLFVAVQVAVAVLLLVIPALEFLRGDTYFRFSDGRQVDPGALRFGLPGAETNKNQVANHYGQFHNPNALGLYAVIAIATGLSLCLVSRRLLSVARLAGAALLVAGGFLWLNTLTRGPILALAVMCVAICLLIRDVRMPPLPLRAIRWGAIAMCAAGLVGAVLLGVFNFLFVSTDSITVTARLEGYREGWDVVLAHPVFGYGAEYEWPEGRRPHLVPLLFAAEYGVLIGLFITWLLFWYCGTRVLRDIRDPYTSIADSVFTALGYASVAGIALTNNFAAPALCALLVGHIILTGNARAGKSGPTESAANERGAAAGAHAHPRRGLVSRVRRSLRQTA